MLKMVLSHITTSQKRRRNVMDMKEYETRKQKAQSETLVISKEGEGYRVFSAHDPRTIYLITASPDGITCTCPDFRFHTSEPDWRCKHIIAVLNQTEAIPVESSAVPSEQETPPNGNGKQRKRTNGHKNGTPQMVLKRSVSPDGRIDSLSVEFACPVDKATVEEIKTRALNTLELQSDIVGSFLDGQRPVHATGNGDAPVHDKSMQAQLLNVAGMNGKWGRRLFINVQVNGSVLKLFGNRKELGESIVAAGYPGLADHIEEGMQLNLPCRVTTKPSEDRKYVNIEQVLPPGDGQGQRRMHQ
jgi:hypothetical protein